MREETQSASVRELFIYLCNKLDVQRPNKADRYPACTGNILQSLIEAHVSCTSTLSVRAVQSRTSVTEDTCTSTRTPPILVAWVPLAGLLNDTTTTPSPRRHSSRHTMSKVSS